MRRLFNADLLVVYPDLATRGYMLNAVHTRRVLVTQQTTTDLEPEGSLSSGDLVVLSTTRLRPLAFETEAEEYREANQRIIDSSDGVGVGGMSTDTSTTTVAGEDDAASGGGERQKMIAA